MLRVAQGGLHAARNMPQHISRSLHPSPTRATGGRTAAAANEQNNNPTAPPHRSGPLQRCAVPAEIPPVPEGCRVPLEYPMSPLRALRSRLPGSPSASSVLHTYSTRTPRVLVGYSTRPGCASCSPAGHMVAAEVLGHARPDHLVGQHHADGADVDDPAAHRRGPRDRRVSMPASG
jgi:hypothetical protein